MMRATWKASHKLLTLPTTRHYYKHFPISIINTPVLSILLVSLHNQLEEDGQLLPQPGLGQPRLLSAGDSVCGQRGHPPLGPRHPLHLHQPWLGVPVTMIRLSPAILPLCLAIAASEPVLRYPYMNPYPF